MLLINHTVIYYIYSTIILLLSNLMLAGKVLELFED